MIPDKEHESRFINESFKAEFTEKLRTFKKSNNLYGVEIVYMDPDDGKTTWSIKTRGKWSWEDYEKEIFEIIESRVIVSYSFPDPEP